MAGAKIYLRQIQVGEMDNFIYLIGDPAARECVMVDPAWEVRRALKIAEKDGMKVTAGLLTHTHFDHCNGAEELCLKAKRPLWVHEAEAGAFEGTDLDVVPVRDGAAMPLGTFAVSCLHTPGHTPGSQCFLVAGNLFTGDTLFVNACGRCDLPGGSAEALYQSLQRLKALPDSTVVYPGHDYGDEPVSSIGLEKERNPYLQFPTVEDFVRLRLGY